MKEKKILISNLRLVKAKWGIPQKDIGAVFGISKATWSNYERGNSTPGYDTLVLLSKKTGISVDTLITREVTWDEIQNLKAPYTSKSSSLSIVSEDDSEYQPSSRNLNDMRELVVAVGELLGRLEDISRRVAAIEEIIKGGK